MSEEPISNIADNSSWKKSKRKMERMRNRVNPESVRNLNRSTISSISKTERTEVLDNVIGNLPGSDDGEKITDEEAKRFKERNEENVKHFKVGDKEYRFNITDNIVKDIMLEEIEKNGKENFDPKNVTSRLDEYLGDKNSESIHFRFHKIPENDRLKYYQLLVKYANFLIYEQYKSLGKDYSEIWKHFIKPIIDNGRIFQLDEDIVSILDATDSKKTEIPFNQILIDCRFPIEDRIYYGMMVGKYFTDNKNNPGIIKESEVAGKIIGTGCFTCYSRLDVKDGERKLHLEYFDFDGILSEGNKLTKYQKRLSNFFYSFCNFINEPEVEIIETTLNPKNNERRAERGSMPLPSNSVIKIAGTLKKYISDFNSGMSSGIGHRFIVRGHFMHFRNEERYSRLYGLSDEKLMKSGYQKSNEVIKKWLKPFSKGKGILVDKTYKVLKGGKK